MRELFPALPRRPCHAKMREMDLNDIPLFIENVDIDRYRAADRKIRHVFNGASTELVAMVINFAHSRDLGVPSYHRSKGWDRRNAALDKLLAGGYVETLV